MAINKVCYYTLLGCLTSSAASLATPTTTESDPDGTLVQCINNEKILHPLFSPSFVKELHFFIKRSYRITKRGEDAYDYLCEEQLQNDRINTFTDTSLTDTWHCYRPFSGIHGAKLSGLIGLLPNTHASEIDMPGFVAVRQATSSTPPTIVVVFRGSQAEDFQPLNGALGPSWLTNFDAAKKECPNTLQLHALFHQGYLNKYLSARQSVFAALHECINSVPEYQQSDIRFIITGHSQGAAVCLPAALDIVHKIGPDLFGDDFNNLETPRFFVYTLSGPNCVGDAETKQLIYDVIGRDNIIRHFSTFDLVPYLCLGKQFNGWACKHFLKALMGMETGYLPVGHIAIDDCADLTHKWLEINHRSYTLQHDEQRIIQHCLNGYKDSIHAYLHKDCVNIHYKIKALRCYHQAAVLLGGVNQFIALHHFGSCYAFEMDPKPTNESTHDTTYMSFDPRLPECDLAVCLSRGELHRQLYLGLQSPDRIDQVYKQSADPDLTDIEVDYDSDAEDEEDYSLSKSIS